MREIKFRAWDAESQEMIDADSLAFDTYAPLCEQLRDSDEMKFMQFTDMKDKNGVEIYEGDICKYKVSIWPSYLDYEEVKVVEGLRCSMFDGDSSGGQDFYESISDIEVIGNIYENPELINK